MPLNLPVSYALAYCHSDRATGAECTMSQWSCMLRRGQFQHGALQDRVEEQKLSESFEAYLGCRSIPEVCRSLHVRTFDRRSLVGAPQNDQRRLNPLLLRPDIPLPYSYLAFHKLQQYVKLWKNVQIHYYPASLGAIMKVSLSTSSW